MSHVRETIYIEASPEEVWALGSDPKRIPEWNTTVVEVKDASPTLDEPGARFTAVSKIAGRPIEITWTIERLERPRFFEASATSNRGGSGRQRVEYAPEGSGTRLTLDLEYELAPGLLGEVIDKLFAERAIARDVRHSFENFKAILEEERAAVGSR